MPLPPVLQDVLMGVARAGVKASVAAFDSLLEDFQEGLLQETQERVARTRAKAQKITGGRKAVRKGERP